MLVVLLASHVPESPRITGIRAMSFMLHVSSQALSHWNKRDNAVLVDCRLTGIRGVLLLRENN